MATFAADETQRQLAELDGRTREAWAAYKDGLGDLEGHDYDAAEAASWEALQDTLSEIEADRARVEASPDASREG